MEVLAPVENQLEKTYGILSSSVPNVATKAKQLGTDMMQEIRKVFANGKDSDQKIKDLFRELSKVNLNSIRKPLKMLNNMFSHVPSMESQFVTDTLGKKFRQYPHVLSLFSLAVQPDIGGGAKASDIIRKIFCFGAPSIGDLEDWKDVKNYDEFIKTKKTIGMTGIAAAIYTNENPCKAGRYWQTKNDPNLWGKTYQSRMPWNGWDYIKDGIFVSVIVAMIATSLIHISKINTEKHRKLMWSFIFGSSILFLVIRIWWFFCGMTDDLVALAFLNFQCSREHIPPRYKSLCESRMPNAKKIITDEAIHRYEAWGAQEQARKKEQMRTSSSAKGGDIDASEINPPTYTKKMTMSISDVLIVFYGIIVAIAGIIFLIILIADKIAGPQIATRDGFSSDAPLGFSYVRSAPKY